MIYFKCELPTGMNFGEYFGNKMIQGITPVFEYFLEHAEEEIKSGVSGEHREDRIL